MASETFVSAMMLITAVVASAILITAVFPIVWNMVGTLSSASHDTDTRMRTDFKIVTTYCYHAVPATNVIAKIWMKNIGSAMIGPSEIQKSDVFIGRVTNFDRSTFQSGKISTPSSPQTIDVPSSNGRWCYLLLDDNANGYWDQGETLEVDAGRSGIFTSQGLDVYFQFVTPSGVFRESEFVTS